jgi:hypothetical protein
VETLDVTDAAAVTAFAANFDVPGHLIIAIPEVGGLHHRYERRAA